MIKNIVFFIQNFSRGAGSERVVSIIANGLAEKGFNVSIVSICGNNTAFYPLSDKIKLFTLIDKPVVDNKKSFFKVLSRLKKFYKTHKTDLVISVFAALSIYTLLLKNKFKYKNITWEHFNFKAKMGLNPLGRKYSGKKSDMIVTLTEQDKGYYIEGLKKLKSKIECVCNPSPYETQTSPFDRENNVIAVGRLSYQKGYDKLIKIWGNVKNHNGYTLLLIGDGAEKENLLKVKEQNDVKDIEFISATPKIYEYYKKAKIFLSTSRFEGLPMTMIEAQSFGIPIISYDYDTGPRDIIKDGENGYLVENDNQNLFIEKLQSLILNEDLIKEMEGNSLEISKQFKEEPILNKWVNIIRGLE